jgi:hypothetical protein
VRLGCAQDGGVVAMSDGTVTFKGGTIANATAWVRTALELGSRTALTL